MFKYSKYNANKYQVHTLAYDLIYQGAKVLDLGCATGYFGKELMLKTRDIYGVELDSYAMNQAKAYYKKIIKSDLNCFDTRQLPKRHFDFILLLDVIEHLTRPKQLLQKITKLLGPNGRLVISTPNILHISVRSRMLLGQFSYEKYGILDETHVHFYTIKSLIDIVGQAGYKLVKVIPSADLGQIPLFGRFLRRIPQNIQYFIVKIAPNLLAAQFIVVCSL